MAVSHHDATHKAKIKHHVYGRNCGRLSLGPRDVAAFDQRQADVIDRLRRRRLPWDSDTARLAVELVTELGDFDDQRVAIALRGAEMVALAGAADAALLAALRRCAVWLDTVSSGRWRVPEMRLLVRQVLAATTPPEFLDLSLLRDGDAWAEPARTAARALPAADVAPLVRALGSLGERKPSRSWLSSIRDALQPASAQQLLKAWLELAAQTDVVPPDGMVGFSGAMLFAHGNTELVRASVFATELLTDEAWVPAVLGVLARRGAATSGVPAMTASLSLKVASAAIDTLAVRDTGADRDMLEQLFEDLFRRDLLKRIGRYLGRQAESARRDEELRKLKAAAVRAKADPAPPVARAATDALIRRHLAPVLRRHGFKGSGRTWRRLHPDRVDVIAIGSSDRRIQLSYGTRFDAVHPPGAAYPVDRTKVRDYHLDIRLFADWDDTDAAFADAAAQLSDTVVPFLDKLGRYEFVRAHLEHETGRGPLAQRAQTASPHDDGVLGLLALAAGDRVTALDCLTRRVEFSRSRANHAAASSEAVFDSQFWQQQFGAARRLT